MYVEMKNLEIHVTHACNLACQQCSHGSNHKLGTNVSFDDLKEWLKPWRTRVRPKQFSILGGEPTLHPDLCNIVRLCRTYFAYANVQLITNGWFLDKHPDLGDVLAETNTRLDVSIHHTSDEYMEKVKGIREITDRWKAKHPKLHIVYRESTKNWRMSYDLDGQGMPVPFDDGDPYASWDCCNSKWCPQLFEGKIYKCPQITYWPMMVEKLKLEKKNWELALGYKPLDPSCTDEELFEFVNRGVESVCGLCPAHQRLFALPSPIRGS